MHFEPVEIALKRLPNGAGLDAPSYETPGAAGMDVCSAEGCTVRAGRHAMIPTGFAVAMPEGYEIQVRPRSGLAAKHGIGVLNAPGTIDCDYRGEVKVLLINHGDEDFAIARGDRIAQLVVAPVQRGVLVEVDELDDTQRGGDGFGSTGV